MNMNNLIFNLLNKVFQKSEMNFESLFDDFFWNFSIRY
jgi:hypothetical protein